MEKALITGYETCGLLGTDKRVPLIDIECVNTPVSICSYYEGEDRDFAILYPPFVMLKDGRNADVWVIGCSKIEAKNDN